MMEMVKHLPLLKRLYPSLLKKWYHYRGRAGFLLRQKYRRNWLLNIDHYIDRQILLYGDYEKPQRRYLDTMIARYQPDVFFDIGANFGWYALSLAQNHPEIFVHAFEPDPRNLDRLRANFCLNAPLANITIHPFALSHEKGEAFFTLFAEKSSGQSALSLEENQNSKEQRITVRTERFDEITRDFHLADNCRALIKIDVEGHEAKVIEGARGWLQNHQAVLQIECFPDRVAHLTKLMTTLGYRHLDQIDDDHYFTNIA